jgi:hypothetical protein
MIGRHPEAGSRALGKSAEISFVHDSGHRGQLPRASLEYQIMYMPFALPGGEVRLQATRVELGRRLIELLITKSHENLNQVAYLIIFSVASVSWP